MSRKLADWRKQAIVRAIVMGDLTITEIANEYGVDRSTVQKVEREMDAKDKPEQRRQVA